MSEKNKRIARRVFEDVQSQGNQMLIKELVTEDYVGHTPLGDIHGPEGAKQFTSMLHAGFPNFQVTVEAQIAEGDLVATRWISQGLHNGEFQGVPPTGKRMAMSGMTIFRIANGKLVEGWTQPDLLGLMQQLGVVPLPEGVN
jgi:predicted ester cyclase